MAVKQAEQKSSVVQQAEEVAAQAIKANQPIHHIFRSITELPSLVAATHAKPWTAEQVDDTLAGWANKGYDLFQVYLLSSEKGGVNKTHLVNHMLYILKQK